MQLGVRYSKIVYKADKQVLATKSNNSNKSGLIYKNKAWAWANMRLLVKKSY